MKSTFTSTGSPAGAPAKTPRRHFARTAGTALISAALLITAPAALAQTTAPSSIAGALLHGTVTASTGGLSNSATFSQLFTADTDYNVALNGGVPASPQTYTYATTGADTATITETTVAVSLQFTTRTSGSFATSFTSGGTQSGTFTLELVATPPLVNISTRTLITAGGNAIGGFSIVGDVPRRLLVRVVGPTLGGLGVSDPLANPKLTIYDNTSTPIATNDDWDADTNNGDAVRAAQTATGAFALNDGSADAAMVITLDPGLYTVIGEGVAADDTGEVLIEAYYIE